MTRKTRASVTLGIVASLGLIGFATMQSRGQKPDDVGQQPVATASPTPPFEDQETLPPCAIPVDLDDQPFSRYVDLLLLGQAWDYHDPSLLTDLGLQLVHGEQVLLRPHKAIESGNILELAARIAAERQDNATLERLKKVAASSKRLAAVLTEMNETKAQLQSPQLSMGHPIEDLSPEAVALHQFAIKKVRAARLAGDHALLDKIDSYLDTFTTSPKGQQKMFDDLIANARASMPKDSRLGPTLKILDRLAAITPCDKIE